MDVGDRYVGLAVSDPFNEIASPHSVLIRKQSNLNSTVNKLEDLVRRFSVMGFVIGYPLGLRGFNGPQAFQVKLFVKQLQKTGRFESLNYTYHDERLTTKAVECRLKPLNFHPVQMKHTVDKFAAVGILQVTTVYPNMVMSFPWNIDVGCEYITKYLWPYVGLSRQSSASCKGSHGV